MKFRPVLAPVPEITFAELAEKTHCAAFFDKAVFVGITAQSAAQDRHSTPLSFGQTMVGVAINANAYETLASRTFLRPAGNLETVGRRWRSRSRPGRSSTCSAVGWRTHRRRRC